MRNYELTGKKCYDHLGGKLGATLFEFLISQKWIEPKEGTSTTYVMTETGYKKFAKMGWTIPPKLPRQGEGTE